MDRDVAISFNAALTAVKNKVQTIAAGTVPVDNASRDIRGEVLYSDNDPEPVIEDKK